MAKDVNISFVIDQKAVNWFTRHAPQKLTEARERAVTAAGMVWADQAKQITRDENHVDTGLYVNSIGYGTGNPANPLHEITENTAQQTTLAIGADVAYASSLEKQYGIMARAIDLSEQRMNEVATTQISKTLFG